MKTEKVNHTPGPWRYEQDDQAVYGKSMREKHDSEFMVADVRGWGHLQYLGNGAGIQDANGKLIAAAPDLFEALDKIAAAALGGENVQEKIYKLAVEAIKKATV